MILQVGRFEASFTDVTKDTGDCDVIIQPPIHLGEYAIEELRGVRSSEVESHGIEFDVTITKKSWTDRGIMYNLFSEAFQSGDYSAEEASRHFEAIGKAILSFGEILD